MSAASRCAAVVTMVDGVRELRSAFRARLVGSSLDVDLGEGDAAGI
tara:strand:+ start:293 stop:430 length:138 start_codon:yes stop_codon:yes gene_type:complete